MVCKRHHLQSLSSLFYCLISNTNKLTYRVKKLKKTLGILPSHENNLFFFRSKMVFLNLYFFHYKWCLDSCLWTSPSMFEGEVFKEHPPGNIIKHFFKNTIETSLLSWILHFWKLYNKLPDFSVVIIYQPAKCKLKYS